MSSRTAPVMPIAARASVVARLAAVARRSRFADRSLVWKTTAVTASIVGAAIAIAVWTASGIAERALRNEIVGAGKALVLSFGDMNALEFLDKQQGTLNLRLRLQRLIATDTERRLRRAFVLTAERKVFLWAGSDERLPELPASIDQVTVVESASGITVASPVRFEKTVLGYVVFEFDKAQVKLAAARMARQAALVIIGAVSVAALLLFLLMRRVLAPVVTLGFAASEFARGNHGFRITGELGNDEIGTAARNFNAMCDELAVHMKFTKGALVDRIRRGGVTDAGEEHQLSIVFGDARGYTNWSQQYPANEVLSTLGRYFTCVGKITVERFGGIIDKFIGDGVMAHFGLVQYEGPFEPPDTVVKAARDALRATIYGQHALRILAHAITTCEDREALVYRFGVASGRCLMGAIGARGVKLDFSVIGNVVNLASRLEGLAVPGGILIDRFTLTDVGTDFADVVDSGEQLVKGIEQPIQTYAVRGFSSAEENERLQQFLLDEFLSESLIADVMLGGRGSKDDAHTVRQFAEQELAGTPTLPV